MALSVHRKLLSVKKGPLAECIKFNRLLVPRHIAPVYKANGPRLHINISPCRGCRRLLSRLARAKEAIDLALLEAVLLLAHLPASPQPQTPQHRLEGFAGNMRGMCACAEQRAQDAGAKCCHPTGGAVCNEATQRILCPACLFSSETGRKCSHLLTWQHSHIKCKVTPEEGVHAFLCSQSGCLTRGTGLATRCMAAGMVMIFWMALPRRSL